MRGIITQSLILTGLLLTNASCTALDNSAWVRIDMPLAPDETQRFYLSTGVAE